MKLALSKWRAWWDTLHHDQSQTIEEIPAAWVKLAVFATSALALYVEMVIVRWHATCFHAFAIFKNVSLLSCFLGLGIGFGLAGRRRITLASFLPLLAFQAALFGLVSGTNLGGRRINPVAEQLVMGTSGAHWGWFDAVEGNLFLAAVFVLNAVMFVPLGQLAGKLMSRLPKTQGYSLNLLGSLAGVGLFFLLSLAWTPPAVWFGVAALALAPFLIGHRKAAAVGIASMAVILLALGLMGGRNKLQYYSPYQVITLKLPEADATHAGVTLDVNHCFYQQMVDCRPQVVAGDSKTAAIASYYDLPFRLQPEPGDVLVVGAGSGNDVAASLRHGARSVTAVEIDPAILYLGKRLHPERPYADTRVHSVLNDARTFLRHTGEHFDTIVYGLLDSHTNLGAMTNVRLDSFVYTVEGFREAVSRLKPDGLLVVSYDVLSPTQGARLYAMLREAYPDQAPRALAATCGTTFVTGPGLRHVPTQLGGIEELTADFQKRADHVEVATDDWPFFYMQRRTYPITYAIMVLGLLVLAGVLLKKHIGQVRISGPGSGAFFFLGAGFMLIETKGITELGLVFGNTWSVIAVVISAILLMAYLANQYVHYRGPVRHRVSFSLLGATLLLGLLVTRLSTAGVVVPLAPLVMPIILTLPLFCGGLVFSSELATRGEIGQALFANLLGAMLGGFLEYNSMYWGFSSLYPLGMGLYALAWLCTLKKAAAAVVQLPGTPEPLRAAG
ncbi:MAG TPA: hypothetical protein VFA18_14780 [Gemmataceae bacterium]|nr:hypothetical protein [Gemmataceae bacterium]